MHRRKEGQGGELGKKVVGEPHVQVAFPVEQDPVPDDVVHAVHEGQKKGHQKRNETVGRDVERAGEIVFPRGVVREKQGPCHQKRQAGRNQERQHQVCPVAQLGHKCPAQKGPELVPLVLPADPERRGLKRRGRLRRRRFAQADLAHVLQEPETLILVAPVIWRKPARRHKLAPGVFLVDHVPAQVPERGFENVKDELRAGGSAGGAAAQFSSKMLFMFSLGKVAEHFARGAVEHQFAALVQEQRLGEHLEELRVGLVNGHQHYLVVRHRADDFDDVLAVLGTQATGGLVKQEHVRRADHVQADVQPLAFPAGEPFFSGTAHDRVPPFAQPEFHQFALDPAGSFPAGEVRGPNRCGKKQVLLDGELLIKGIVLRDVRNEAFERVHVLVERLTVEQDLPGGRLELSRNRTEKGRFSASAGPHHTHHLAARHTE